MSANDVYININPVNFFIISGLVHNFILAAILFFKPGDRMLANRLLALTIIIVNLHLAYLIVLDTNLDNLYPPVLWIPFSFLTAIGPLVYFYTCALTDMNFVITKNSLKHFLPVFIEFGLQVLMIIQSIRTNELLYNTPFYFLIAPLIYACAAVSIIFYLKKSLRTINQYEIRILKNFSNLKELTLSWLKKLIIYYRLLWVLWVPFMAAFLLFFRYQLQYLAIVLALYLLMLSVIYLTFWIGIQAIGHGNLIYLKNTAEKPVNKNYSRLTSTEIQYYIERISHLMTSEKLYLNENLSLKELASQLEADPNLISFIINNQFNTNFHDYINHFRLEEFKNKLNNPAYKHLTILGMALDSGFNSKTTFNRVFKQAFGITPSEFQRKYQAK